MKQKTWDCGRVEKGPIGCLGPAVETLSSKARRMELYKGPGQDIGSFCAKGGFEQSRPDMGELITGQTREAGDVRVLLAEPPAKGRQYLPWGEVEGRSSKASH